ncbi:hypothetical protein GIB67_034950, partial [Kingdonia uniflora]
VRHGGIEGKDEDFHRKTTCETDVYDCKINQREERKVLEIAGFIMVLDNIRKTCEINNLNCKILGLTWGEWDAPMFSLQPKIVLGADVLYDAKDFDDLFATVAFLLRDTPDAVFLTTYHDKRSYRPETILESKKSHCQVQRYLVGSPHLLLENNPRVKEPAMKVPPKKLPKSPTPIAKQQSGSQKPIQSHDQNEPDASNTKVQSEMMKHHQGSSFGFAKLQFGVRRSPEAKVFKDLVMSNTSKGLVHTLFAQRAVSKKVAVIGGDLMGSEIATTLLLGNIFVVVKEINTEYLQKGMKTIKAKNLRPERVFQVEVGRKMKIQSMVFGRLSEEESGKKSHVQVTHGGYESGMPIGMPRGTKVTNFGRAVGICGTPFGMPQSKQDTGRGESRGTNHVHGTQLGWPLVVPRASHVLGTLSPSPKMRNQIQAQASPIGAANPGLVQLKTDPNSHIVVSTPTSNITRASVNPTSNKTVIEVLTTATPATTESLVMSPIVATPATNKNRLIGKSVSNPLTSSTADLAYPTLKQAIMAPNPIVPTTRINGVSPKATPNLARIEEEYQRRTKVANWDYREKDQVLQNQEETSIPESTKPALEEEVIEEKEEEPQLMDEVEAAPAADTGDLLVWGDPTNPGFANFGGNASGWELALVTNPRSNTTHVTERKLAGGFDRLLLDSLYEDTTSRGQPQNLVYGGGMSVQNPFDPRDPFSRSSNIAPPTNVQMAMSQQQQHQLMFQLQQHHQQQNMMMAPHQYSQQQQYLPQYSQQQQYLPQYPQQQMNSPNPFGDPFMGIPQSGPSPTQENHSLI